MSRGLAVSRGLGVSRGLVVSRGLAVSRGIAVSEQRLSCEQSLSGEQRLGGKQRQSVAKRISVVHKGLMANRENGCKPRLSGSLTLDLTMNYLDCDCIDSNLVCDVMQRILVTRHCFVSAV